MIFYVRPSIGRRGGTITEDSFSFAGDYLFARDEESGDWELALLESGTLDWLTLPGDVDIFLVGAGQDGGDAYWTGAATLDYNDSFINSGAGGAGGRVLTASGVTLDGSCAVVVGTDGADSSISCNGRSYTSANGPAPREGGRGAEMRQATNSAGTVNNGGVDGVNAYGAPTDETMIPELAGVLYAASGGGGHANNNYGNQTWLYVYTDNHGGIDTGGQTGGGKGGGRSHHSGYDAEGYGSGGGGGYGDGASHDLGQGGHGSDGIILIRNHREVS